MYIGSKNRFSKEIVPIIQSYITPETRGYLEPFVGGGNVIDKIDFPNKIGCDIHKYLIALLQQAQVDASVFPESITEDEYKNVFNNYSHFPDWYVGLVGFCASFGAKWFGGYARNKKGHRSYSQEMIRNLQKQSPNLKNIIFRNLSFQQIPIQKLHNYVVYCDIPYRGTCKYKTSNFPYEEFYDWARVVAINNTVLISEYEMPEDFTCIWEKKTKCLLDSKCLGGDEKNVRTEKLFIKQI